MHAIDTTLYIVKGRQEIFMVSLDFADIHLTTRMSAAVVALLCFSSMCSQL